MTPHALNTGMSAAGAAGEWDAKMRNIENGIQSLDRESLWGDFDKFSPEDVRILINAAEVLVKLRAKYAPRCKHGVRHSHAVEHCDKCREELAGITELCITKPIPPELIKSMEAHAGKVVFVDDAEAEYHAWTRTQDAA